MKKEYNPEEIEQHVQECWDKYETFKVKEEKNKKKYYCLSMLPYPSGHLHMGHIRNYTIGDVISRYQRMQGKNVLQPIGWDAFGLPAENAAIKNNISPAEWTYKNIHYMKQQLKRFGFSYDWSRELTTCKPEYYRWEQWFFTKLYEKGIVYKKKSPVNWCKNDQTVLANEQVINGCCWRCSSKIQRKTIPQWFIKITNYAEELLNDLNTLKYWPKQVKEMQRNWIGRSEGLEITFNILNHNEKIVVYTTRPDAFFGITFIALSVEHPISCLMAKTNQKIANFIAESKKTQTSESLVLEKKGININFFAIHPLNKEKLPIWITNFVLMEHATGAIMGVPAHNQHDFEFAKKYHLPIKNVIFYPNSKKSNFHSTITKNKGILLNSGKFNGLNNKDAYNAISNDLIKKGIAIRKINYRLRDWCVSRQRYWGTPIPMLQLEDGKIIPTPENQLPVILPKDKILNGKINKIKDDSKWRNVTIKNKKAWRETDTLDTFVESSWYYARYTCNNYNEGMLDPKTTNYWLPIDQYIGGIEHAVMHLIYFRFYHKLLRDAGFVNSNEPAKRLLCQGMVLADAFYFIDENKKQIWVPISNVIITRDKKGNILKATDLDGKVLIHDGMSKMSKSKNNGIDPMSILKKYGADTLRLFIMFAAPVELPFQWKDSGIKGIHRFLKRLWKIVFEHTKKQSTILLNTKELNDHQKKIRCIVHKTITKVNDHIIRQTFNTAISAIMELTNKLSNFQQKHEQDHAIIQEALLAVVRMLYPFTPHISYVMWNALNKKNTIDNVLWPIANKTAIIDDHKILLIQINGKIRDKISVPKDVDQKKIYEQIIEKPTLKKYLDNVKIHKVIYIPGKIVNFVIG